MRLLLPILSALSLCEDPLFCSFFFANLPVTVPDASPALQSSCPRRLAPRSQKEWNRTGDGSSLRPVATAERKTSLVLGIGLHLWRWRNGLRQRESGSRRRDITRATFLYTPLHTDSIKHPQIQQEQLLLTPDSYASLLLTSPTEPGS